MNEKETEQLKVVTEDCLYVFWVDLMKPYLADMEDNLHHRDKYLVRLKRKEEANKFFRNLGKNTTEAKRRYSKNKSRLVKR